MVAVVDLQFYPVAGFIVSKKDWFGFGAIRQDAGFVAVGASDAINTAANVFCFILVIDFPAILAGEVMIFVAIVAQGYIMSIDGDVARAEKPTAMAASVIVIGATSAHEPVIVIYGYYVCVGYLLIAIFAISIVVIAAIFADIIVTPNVVLCPP